MAVTTEISQNEVKLKIYGKFDINSYQEFSQAYKGTISTGRRYIIDLVETDLIDSAALGMLLLLRERAGGDDADINIVNANSDIMNIFKVANFYRLFNIE